MVSVKNLSFSAIVMAVKTGVAAVAAVYAAKLLKLPQELWAAVSAIVVMQSQVAATIAASRDRLIGTAIGAAMGAVFLAYEGDSLPWFGVAVILTMLICQILGLDQSYRLACVTVAIVMLIPHISSPWTPAVHRFEEVALGIVVALVVTAIPVRKP